MASSLLVMFSSSTFDRRHVTAFPSKKQQPDDKHIFNMTETVLLLYINTYVASFLYHGHSTYYLQQSSRT